MTVAREHPDDAFHDAARSEALGQTSEQLVTSAELGSVPTPFLAIDLDAMERNIMRMQEFFSDQTADLRPHVKTHKCTAIAQRQIRAGAIGVTCSTTDEARAMARAGVEDILLANVATDGTRLAALAEIAGEVSVTAAVDSAESVQALAEAARRVGSLVGAVIDCDVGMGRSGVGSVDEGMALAELISDSPSLALRGVMGYEGHVVDIVDRMVRNSRAAESLQMPIALRDKLIRDGHTGLMLTGGSTATYSAVGAMPAMTDVQAGTYVLMDNTYLQLAPEFETAAVVIVSVITSKGDGRVIVDAGAKRMATDWGAPALIGTPAEYLYTSEEHTVFRALEGQRPSAGQRVALLPGHICSTMNMYSRVAGCRRGEVETWLEVDARDPLA